MQLRILGKADSATPSNDAIGIDLGHGLAVLPVVQVTNTKTTVAAATGGQTLLAANASRLAATIVNAADKPLHVIENCVESVVAANDSYFVGETSKGAVTGFWEGSAIGEADVSELTL